MGEFTKGPVKTTTCADYWVEHGNPLTKADRDFNGIAHCGDIRWPNHETRQHEWAANARLVEAAFNAATAAEALGYDGQDAIEKLPEMVEVLNAAREFIEAEYRDPAAEEFGEWLAKDARSSHWTLCAALPTRLAESGA